MANIDTYGALYNWYAATDARNIAASGFKVPANTDYETLSDYLGGNTVAGNKLKESGTTYWTVSGGTNISQFSARGGGLRSSPLGSFSTLKDRVYFWNAGSFTSVDGYISYIQASTATFFTYNTGVAIYSLPKISGASVRLIRDGATTLDDGQFGTYTGNDGREYETICIGTQEWLAENLRETKYRNGDTIPVVTDASAWIALTTGAMCAYDNDGTIEAPPEPEPDPDPTYGIKYRIRFSDYFANVWRYELLFPDYTGGISPLIGSGDPLFIRCEVAENNPFTVIKSRSAEFEVISMTREQYIDIFDATHKVQTRIYKGEQLHFHGWVLQEEWKEPDQLGRYKAKIVSVDGLALLRDVMFEPVSETLGNARFYGMLSCLNVLSTCLEQTGLNLQILDGNILYEQSQDEAHTALRQFYVNRAIFRDGVGYCTCYQAIETILRSMCCRITQQYTTEGLVWLIQNVPGLNAAHNVVVMSSTGTETGTATIDDFVLITGSKGSPLNVFIDHSAFKEIDEAPHWLRVVSDYGYDGNLIKDYFDYNDEGVTSVYNKLYKSLTIEGDNVPDFQKGVAFNLGWVDLRKLATMNLSFNWSGRAHMRAAIVIYGSDSVVYYYNASGTTFQDITGPLAWATYWCYSGVYDPDRDMVSCRLDIDTDMNISGRMVLFLYAETGGTYYGDNTIDLDTLSVDTTDYYPKTGEVDERALSITNNKVREQNLILSQFPVGSWTVPGFPAWDNSGYPTYAMRNQIFIDNGDTIDFPTPLGFYSLGDSVNKMLLLSWVTNQYYQVYAENRFRMSGVILGQMNLTSILQKDGRTYLIDSWNFNVKKSTHQVVLMEIGKYDRILVTEDGTEIVTDDGNNIEV